MNVLASAVVYEGLHHIAKVHAAIDVGVRVIAIGNEYMEAKMVVGGAISNRRRVDFIIVIDHSNESRIAGRTRIPLG